MLARPEFPTWVPSPVASLLRQWEDILLGMSPAFEPKTPHDEREKPGERAAYYDLMLRLGTDPAMKNSVGDP